MTPAPLSSSASLPSRSYRILLVDDDRVYRSGLRLWLEQTLGAVVIEAETSEAALRSLSLPNSPPLDLIILSLSLSASNLASEAAPEQAAQGFAPGFGLCRQVRDRAPQLPILALSSSDAPLLAAVARQAGATQSCTRNIAPPYLAMLIQQMIEAPAGLPAIWSADSLSPIRPAPFARLRRNLRQSGLQQIDQTLAELLEQLRDPSLSVWERAVTTGRVRELRTSRWLVRRLLSTPLLPEVEPNAATDTPPLDPPRRRNSSFSGAGGPAAAWSPPRSTPANELRSGRSNSPPSRSPSLTPEAAERASIVPIATPALDIPPAHVPTLSLLFDEIADKLQGPLENLTDKPLETDILRVDQKRTLFLLILRKLEDLLNELRFSQVPADQFEERRSQLLLDLWEASLIDFFGRYTTVPLQGYEVEIAGSLLQDGDRIRTAILDKIPGFPALLSHLLIQTPLLIDGSPYPAGNPEALLRAEILLSNLTIQLANAVVQPLLNRFADQESIKQTFYDRRLLSSREIERFRNNLSWKYRVERYFEHPRDIFESQYRLLTFHPRGLYSTAIYAPRRSELEQLSGIQYAVTLALETRDAIAPRLRSAISVVGSSIIYVLTEVIGRGIGLVGRGVLKGIGNTWQEGRRRRDEREG